MPRNKRGPVTIKSPPISRRAMIAFSSISALSANQAIAASVTNDKAATACLRFVELQDQSMTLADEWPVLESWLCYKYPNFLGMSEEEKARLPETSRFEGIRKESDAVEAEIEKLLPVVLKVKCRTPVAIVAKLMAVERIIYHEENPQAKKLLLSCIEDLGDLLSVKTWQWASPYPPSPIAWPK